MILLHHLLSKAVVSLSALILHAAAQVSSQSQPPPPHAQTTTLLSPSGYSLGGIWQQWINKSYMPTYRGTMVLDVVGMPLTGCTNAPLILGCTATSAFTDDVDVSQASLPETEISAPPHSDPRWVLLYEQGHVIDFRYLTDSDRFAFLALWRQPPPPSGESMNTYWWTGESTGKVQETYGEWFSADYALCALYWQWTFAITQHIPGEIISTAEAYPGLQPTFQNWLSKRLRWEISTQQRSCSLIRSWIEAA